MITVANFIFFVVTAGLAARYVYTKDYGYATWFSLMALYIMAHSVKS